MLKVTLDFGGRESVRAVISWLFMTKAFQEEESLRLQNGLDVLNVGDAETPIMTHRMKTTSIENIVKLGGQRRFQNIVFLEMDRQIAVVGFGVSQGNGAGRNISPCHLKTPTGQCHGLGAGSCPQI